MGEMRPLRLDPETARRLVDGSLAPDDAPPGYAGVTELLSAARGVASSNEPVRQRATVAAMEAVVLERLGTQTIDTRRKHVRMKSLAAKTAAASTVVLLGAGAAAAATGTLPGTANTTSSVPGNSNGHANSGGDSSSAGNTNNAGQGTANTANAGSSNRQGNGPNSHALPGLCHAMSVHATNGITPNSNSVFSVINCNGVTTVGGGNATHSGTDQPAGPPSSTPVGPPSSTPPSGVPPVSTPNNGSAGSSGSDNSSSGLSTASGHDGGASSTGAGAASAGGGNAGSHP